MKTLKQKWRSEFLYGKCPERLDEADVDRHQTHHWLWSSNINEETEGLIIAAQYQCLPTNTNKSKLKKDDSNHSCRLYHKFDETADDMVSTCPDLAGKEYNIRQDWLVKYINWHVFSDYGIDPGYKVKRALEWCPKWWQSDYTVKNHHRQEHWCK